MKVLFTTNNKFWSRVLKCLTSEPFSHIALVFDIDGVQLVVDCSTDGGRLMPIDKFLVSNIPMASIDIMVSHKSEIILFKYAINIVGKKYDFPAYIYGLWRGILFKAFKIGPPIKNRYNTKDKFVCTEILEPIRFPLSLLGISFGDMDFSIQTPYRLYLFLKDKFEKSN
jgi:hypothetical protein